MAESEAQSNRLTLKLSEPGRCKEAEGIKHPRILQHARQETRRISKERNENWKAKRQT